MRTAIILGRRHGAKALLLVAASGPELKIQEVLDGFKDFQRTETHSDLEYVELWVSDRGMAKRRKLINPTVAAAKTEAAERAAAKAEAEKAAEAAKLEAEEAAKAAAAEAAKAEAENQAKEAETKPKSRK